MVIGLDFDNRSGFCRRVISGITRRFADMPEVKLYFPKSNYVNQVPPVRVDGILCLHELDYGRWEGLAAPDVPIVTVGSAGKPATVNVTVDLGTVARLCFEHLMGCNLRTIAFVHVPWSVTSKQWLAYLSEVCSDAKVALHVLEFTNEQLQSDSDRAAELLADCPTPVGVIAPMDLFGAQFIRLCNRAGLKVPDDIQVIGAGNDVERCLGTTPTLTSIDVGSENIGYEAAKTIMAMIRGKSVSGEILIQPRQVIPRQSTRHVDDNSPEVSAALAFMYANLKHEVQMHDLIADLEVSRRKLESMFMDEIGEPPMKHLRSIRLHRVRHLLQTTDLSVVEVGRRCGIPNPSYLGLLFKRTYGMTPLGFRRMQAKKRQRKAKSEAPRKNSLDTPNSSRSSGGLSI